MRIGFATSEVAPFAKVGGLADVASALPRQLQRRGYDVRVFAPLYSQIDRDRNTLFPVEFVQDIDVQIGAHSLRYSLLGSPLDENGSGFYFVDCPALFHRTSIYGAGQDEHVRFLFLCRAILESCQRMGWPPDVLHCNDWQTAALPLYLRTLYAWDSLFGETKTVLTIHNLGYQGTFSGDASDLGLSQWSELLHQEDLSRGLVNLMKMGILYADVLTTVSPTYAAEIQTDDFGIGLQDLLKARHETLVGILNGVDYDEWSPESDDLIPYRYTKDDLTGKLQNKQVLLEELGLIPTQELPVIGMVTRLTSQKGVELLYEPMPRILSRQDVRLVVLGSGEPQLESFFTTLQEAFPGRVCFFRGFNNRLAHLIEAGSDMFLMPSLYEPCGLNQMYSLRYGTPPIVRRTGGLADTVEHWDRTTGRGNGFVFEHYTPEGLQWGLDQALSAFHDGSSWEIIVRNAMSADFSWTRQGSLYEGLYHRLVSQR